MAIRRARAVRKQKSPRNDKRTKRARTVRKREEFQPSRFAAGLEQPTETNAIFGWTVQQILAARDLQILGDFCLPSKMATAMRTDDALFVARDNRLEPQRNIDVAIEPARGPGGGEPGERSLTIAGEAEVLYGPNGIGVTVDTCADIDGCLADHGVAFGVVNHRVREDGTRTDLFLSYWPIEFVRWSTIHGCFMARVAQVPPGEAAAADAYGKNYRSAYEVPIVHGDGRWVVFARHEHQPWTHEACILPGALVWARHARAVRDWSAGSTAHGNAKVVGEMPEGMALTNKDGTPTLEAAAYMDLLKMIAKFETPYGIRPFGSKLDYIANSSAAWQVWESLILNAEKAAARIYLGTDGILGAQGGAPGVDIAKLFGVAATKVLGALSTIERGIFTGVMQPWCAINFGDSTLAPRRKYLIPNPDAAALQEAFAKSWAAFNATIKELRANQFVIDQELVDRVAKNLGIEPPRVADPRGEIFQYDIELGIVSINEVRERKGFSPRTGGDKTVPERDEAALPPAPENQNRPALRPLSGGA